MKACLTFQMVLACAAAVAAGQQYESFVGCFKDNKKRDFGWVMKGKAKGIEDCRKWAKSKGKKYFALQVATECYADNSFGSPRNTYYQLPVSKCVRKGSRCGSSEHMSYCGAGWANAVYSTEPVMPKVKVVKTVTTWLQGDGKGYKEIMIGKYKYKTPEACVKAVEVEAMKDSTITGVTFGFNGAGFACYVEKGWKMPKKVKVDFKKWNGKSWITASVQKGFEVPMQLISPWKMTSLCMYAQASDSNVYMQRCDYRNSRKYGGIKQATDQNYLWTFIEGRLKTPSMPRKCLDMKGNKDVYMHNCHNGNNQKWYWADGATIKNVVDNKRCLDWHLGNNNLYMPVCDQGENQNFWWNFGKTISIYKGVQGSRKHLSTTSNGGKVDLWIKDDGSGRQQWKFVKVGKDTYNIKVTNGISGNRGTRLQLDNGYLSTNSKGTTVDIWGKDDGSGKQRWIVKPVRHGFLIMVAGGVSGKRKYLSTTRSGNKVDLWIKDDGSGRQVWKLHGSHMPTPKPTPFPTPRPTPVPVKRLASGGGWRVVKGYPKCTISLEDGFNSPCAVSPNYPKRYGREVACEFSMKNTKFVTLSGSTEKWFDPVTVGGKQYSGKLAGRVPVEGGKVKWTADFFEETKGWKICKSRQPKVKIAPKKKKVMKGKWIRGDGVSKGDRQIGKYKTHEACLQAALRVAAKDRSITGVTYGVKSGAKNRCYVESGWKGSNKSKNWDTRRLPKA